MPLPISENLLDSVNLCQLCLPKMWLHMYLQLIFLLIHWLFYPQIIISFSVLRAISSYPKIVFSTVYLLMHLSSINYFNYCIFTDEHSTQWPLRTYLLDEWREWRNHLVYRGRVRKAVGEGVLEKAWEEVGRTKQIKRGKPQTSHGLYIPWDWTHGGISTICFSLDSMLGLFAFSKLEWFLNPEFTATGIFTSPKWNHSFFPHHSGFWCYNSSWIEDQHQKVTHRNGRESKSNIK